MNNTYSLDEKDKKILSFLLENGRMSIADIANKTHFQRNLVMRRIANMLEKGVIRKFTPMINNASLGYPNIATVLIKIKTSANETENKFLKYIVSNKFITWVSKIIGKYDFQCAIIYKDTSHLNEIISSLKSYMPGMIEDMEVFQVASEPKIEYMQDLL